jgi:hypothetical protein
MDNKGAEGRRRQPGDGRTERRSTNAEWEQISPDRGKHISIECRTGGEAGGCSGLEGRRSHKAEGAIERKSDWCTFIGRPSETGEGKKVFRYREEGRVWRFEEPDNYRERGWPEKKWKGQPKTIVWPT